MLQALVPGLLGLLAGQVRGWRGLGAGLSGREEDLLAHLPGVGVVLLPQSLGPALCLAACLPAALRSGTPAWLPA